MIPSKLSFRKRMSQLSSDYFDLYFFCFITHQNYGPLKELKNIILHYGETFGQIFNDFQLLEAFSKISAADMNGFNVEKCQTPYFQRQGFVH